MMILGIETSCDDTCCALVEIKRRKINVIKNIAASQTDLHKKYGGVVPEVAARKHVETIIPVINETLLTLPDVIAVASGPGLITSLHVGVETAKALAFAWNKPLVKVNHIEGHIYSPSLPRHVPGLPRACPEYHRGVPPRGTTEGMGLGGGLGMIKFPAIALVVSGGHTELILMKKIGQYRLLGRTRDDAAGECFDKAAKMLGLTYPGGPEIAKRAEKGNPCAFDIPRPMINEDNLEFSFSGMKNAVRLLIEDIKLSRHAELDSASALQSKEQSLKQVHGDEIQDDTLNNLCASIEQAIVDVLAYKSLKAVELCQPKTFILAGGVAANKKLRQTLADALPKKTRFLLPASEFCMDNAAMIAVAGYHQAKDKKFVPYYKLTANANWELV